MTYIDSRLHKEVGSHHASAIYLYFNFQEKTVTIANAGHPYCIVGRQGNQFEEFKTEGSILGYNIQKPIAKNYTLPLRAGDRFFLYTDGLSESTLGFSEIELGSEGVLKILNELKEFLSIQVIRENLVNSIHNEELRLNFHDDMMFLLIEMSSL